jgi:hypothetical protein
MKWNLAPLIAMNSTYDPQARRGNAQVHLLAARDGKEDKENGVRSGGLRSYGSVQQLKPSERTLEKGNSLRMLGCEENKSKLTVKASKHSIGRTVKPLG